MVFWLSGYSASIPQKINLQGRLTDGNGANLPNGSYGVTFSIWNDPTGGTNQWEETQNVILKNSVFQVFLGEINPIPSAIFDGSEKWVQMQVSGETQPLMPRQKLVSVGYAFKAEKAENADNADKLGNEPASDYLRRDVDETTYGNITLWKDTPQIWMRDTTPSHQSELKFKVAGVDGKARAAGIDCIFDSYHKIYTTAGERLHILGWHGFDFYCTDSNKKGWKFTFDSVGNFTATGTKKAIVNTQNYGTRSLYVRESPEIKFIDEGKSRLVNGEKRIDIDPIFLDTIEQNPDDYLIHLTPMGECNGLYVNEVSTGTFVVKEFNNGNSNLNFVWQISAYRKGYKGERLEKFEEQTEAGLGQ